MGVPEIIQSIFLVMCSLVGYAIKKTLEEHLRPMKEDISQLKITMEKGVEMMKEHVDSRFPHSPFEQRLEEKFVTRNEFEQFVELLSDEREHEDEDLN